MNSSHTDNNRKSCPRMCFCKSGVGKDKLEKIRNCNGCTSCPSVMNPQKNRATSAWEEDLAWNAAHLHTALEYLKYLKRNKAWNKVGKQTTLSHRGEVCLVLGFLSHNFLFYFEILTLLSFQVTCPSSCVTDPWLFPPVPFTFMCL